MHGSAERERAGGTEDRKREIEAWICCKTKNQSGLLKETTHYRNIAMTPGGLIMYVLLRKGLQNDFHPCFAN